MRLSGIEREMLERIADHDGLSAADVVRQMIRQRFVMVNSHRHLPASDPDDVINRKAVTVRGQAVGPISKRTSKNSKR